MRRWLLASLTLCAAATAAAQSVRDSAGVRLVSYDARSVAPQRWSVEARPVLEIGGADGSGPTEFSDIVGVVSLANGTIVVGNMKTNELRYFDRAGTFLRSAGRSGQGPGEFMQLWRVAARHDTVVAFDFRYGPRLFAPNGQLIRSVSQASLEGGPPDQSIGPFADGTFLIAASMNIDDPSGYDGSTAMRRVLRVAADGRDAAAVGRFPMYETWSNPAEPGRRPTPFGPVLHVVVLADRFCSGYSRSYELQCYTPNGNLTLVLRRATQSVPISDSARKAYELSVLKARGEIGAAVPERLVEQRRRMLAATVYAERYPAFAAVLAARSGDLWVRDYRPEDGVSRGMFHPAPTTPTQWKVFAPDGRWLSEINLPARFTPFEIGADYLLGVSRDEDDVERVTLWRLRR